MVKIMGIMYGISRWRSLWIIWKNDLCGSKKRKNPGRVGFCFAHPQEDRIRTFRFFYFVLLYSVILGLRPCWGADMRGRMFSNIFWCSGWCGSGFSAGGRGFRPPPFSASSPVSCLGLSNTTDWYVKPRGCSCQVGCERKNRYRIPAWFGFLPFLDPQKSFFQIRIRIRILFVWSWNCPVADFNGNMI